MIRILGISYIIDFFHSGFTKYKITSVETPKCTGFRTFQEYQ
jgi:hypothetical protein